MLVFLAFEKKVVIMHGVWQRSSVVEQRNHNPLVGGPNPSAATRINKRPDGSFFYSVVLTKGDLPREMKRSRINLYKV